MKHQVGHQSKFRQERGPWRAPALRIIELSAGLKGDFREPYSLYILLPRAFTDTAKIRRTVSTNAAKLELKGTTP